MATTTNYSWSTPDDTALVKDGAAAIRTLGSSIDTTTKALNPSTTLGDIEYRSATANTNTRLGIGSTGQVLTVAGGVPSWATSAAGGKTSVATGTLSGASLTISSIPATYKDLELHIFNFDPSTDAAGIEGRFNADSGSNYFFGKGTVSANLGTATTQFELTGLGQDNGTSTAFTQLYIPAYTNTTTWKPAIVDSWTNDPTSPTTQVGYQRTAVMWKNTAAISSIYLQTSAGTFSGGTYILYGVN